MTTGDRGAPPRGRRFVAVAALVLAVGAAGGWSLRTVAGAPPATTAPGFALVGAVEGEVAQDLTVAVSLTWPQQGAVTTRAAGVVTRLDSGSGSTVDQGTVLFRVDERPVVVAVGEVPAYRDLGAGDRGEDVAQVQRMLAHLGHLRGEPTGRFGAATTSAVRAWQRALGVPVTGTVGLADVVFLPHLPAAVAYEGVEVGALLAEGDGAMRVLAPAPDFSVTLSQLQASMVRPGAAVTIPRDDGADWSAVVDVVHPGDDEQPARAALSGIDGLPVCTDRCDTLPVGDEIAPLRATLTVLAPVAGVTVPSAALAADAAGTYVVAASGARIPVTVRASAQGTSVVEGIAAGDEVRLPALLPEEAAA